MMNMLIVYVLVAISTVLGVFSCLYLYRFISSYKGAFRKSIEYIFYSVSLFTLVIIEFGTYGIFGRTEIFSITLAASSVLAFLLMLKAARGVNEMERDLKIESLEERKKFLERKTQLLREKFFKRKIDEQMFKELLKDLEREIVDIEARIEMEREGNKK